MRQIRLRLAGMVPTLLAISFITFMLMAVIPGDPAAVMLGQDADPSALQAVRVSLGLDRPALPRFVWWVSRAVQGDLGTSFYQKRPVATLVLERLPVTFTLCTLATIISVGVGVPAGIASALRRNSMVDHVIRLLSLAGLSTPGFWAGILLLLLFTLRWRILPATGFVPLSTDPMKSLPFFVLPSIALGLSLTGFLSRMTRSTMLDVLNEDYIRTARAKGLSQRVVVYRHGLRSAMLPLMTVIGLNFGALLGGSAVVETVFSLPGVGRLMVFAITQRDFPVVQGAILYVAAMYAAVNLITDLLYEFLDPRIRYS